MWDGSEVVQQVIVYYGYDGVADKIKYWKYENNEEIEISEEEYKELVNE